MVWTGESKTCENNEFLYHYKQTTINKIMFMFIPFHLFQIILNKKKRVVKKLKVVSFSLLKDILKRSLWW